MAFSSYIVHWPAPVLTTPAEPVKAFDAHLVELLEHLAAVMPAAGGVGLAAPQLGVPLRVAVIQVPGGGVLELVNPRCIPMQRDAFRESLQEGCLSVPGEFHRVQRHRAVVLGFQDRDGLLHSRLATGRLAHIVQHEVDHLNGVVFVDHLASMRREAIRQRMEGR